jgi:hypothetical protein
MMPSSSAGRRSGGGPHNTDQARRNGPAIVAPHIEAIFQWAGSSRFSLVETHFLSGLIAKRAVVAGQIEHTQDKLRQLVPSTSTTSLRPSTLLAGRLAATRHVNVSDLAHARRVVLALAVALARSPW